MNWTCTQFEERVSDYLEHLTTPEETAAFLAHLETCPDCAALLSAVGGAVRMMRATPAVDVPPQLFRKIIEATPAPSLHGWRRHLRPVGFLWHPQFAMGALTVAASFLIVFHAAAGPRASFAASLNPLNWVRMADRQAHVTYAHAAKFVSDMQLIYDIESRLEPEPDQPAASPAQPDQQSQPKPEAKPHSGRSIVFAPGLHASLDTFAPFNHSLPRSHS